MKNKFVWLGLSFLLVAAMLLASCTTKTTSSTTKTTTNVITTTSNTTAATGNWWDSLGIPQYGGTFTLRIATEPGAWDPYAFPGENMSFNWLERLGGDNWTLDPKVFNYNIIFRPDAYQKGHLAESWELTAPDTLVYHLRKGIHWQNIAPANGREFISSDVVFHYQRMYGLGSGMTPSPFWSTVTPVGANLVSCVAPDNYTVIFKWKFPNPEYFLQSMEPLTGNADIECPEAVKQWGDLNDWHHAIGTGAFILDDYVAGSTMTMEKNPNYWGHDERYPQNQLPYISKFYVDVITDEATAASAMRTGKIDAYDTVPLSVVNDLKITNPEIKFYTNPDMKNTSLTMRNDLKPFSDIRVRQALQMAINLPEIASSYLKGTVPGIPLTITSYYAKGFGFQYDQWPQDLKDEYAYNPTQAKALLAAAGYPTGFDTDCYQINTADSGMLQIVQSEFAAINVRMAIKVIDPPTFNSFVRANHQAQGLTMPLNGQLGQTFETTWQFTSFKTGYTDNVGMVSDPVFDAFQDAALNANTIEAYQKVLADMNEYCVRHHFCLSLVQSNVNTVAQPWLKGYTGQQGCFIDVMGFYIPRFWIASH